MLKEVLMRPKRLDIDFDSKLKGNLSHLRLEVFDLVFNLDYDFQFCYNVEHDLKLSFKLEGKFLQMIREILLVSVELEL